MQSKATSFVWAYRKTRSIIHNLLYQVVHLPVHRCATNWGKQSSFTSEDISYYLTFPFSPPPSYVRVENFTNQFPFLQDPFNSSPHSDEG